MKCPTISFVLFFSLLLTGCGQGLPSFMHATYPAAKYFPSTPLLPLAQAIEDDDSPELTRLLNEVPTSVCRAQGQEGMTMLLYAMMSRRKQCMQVLLAHGADPNQNTLLGNNHLQVQPIGAAAGGEDSELLTILLDHGGDPNSRFNERPALFAAADADRYDRVRLLLDRGADINATDNKGATLMKRLANLRNFEQVAYLIKRGGDIYKADRVGGTVAFIVQSSHISSTLPAYKWQQEVKLLLEARGVHFPVPHPGIVFQAKVRQENAQRRRWEATAEGRRYRDQLAAAQSEREQADARIYAAGGKLPVEEARSLAAYNRAERLRGEAEPLFQAWRKTQPDWFPTTNDSGKYPTVPTLAEEAAATEREKVASPH